MQNHGTYGYRNPALETPAGDLQHAHRTTLDSTYCHILDYQSEVRLSSFDTQLASGQE